MDAVEVRRVDAAGVSEFPMTGFPSFLEETGSEFEPRLCPKALNLP